VCNLASIVLPRHLTPLGEIDWDSLGAAARLATRHLDDVIDANFYAIPEAERANTATRPIGLGFMGWSDLLERMGIEFASEEAVSLLDRIVEFISYHAIGASADLARERGSFPKFEGSDWSKGIVPIDTLQRLDKERSEPVDVNRDYRLDWEQLREKVAGGMRNGTVMAVAPTATISLIAGTSQSIEPPFSNVYARNNISGKFLEVNENLVTRLKELDLWEEVGEEILLHQGELSDIAEVPDEIKRLFRTAYEISPLTLIRQASAVQKWVDQGASRNIYLTTKNPEALTKVYLEAWKVGLKSTYYAFSQPGSRAEATFAYDESRPKAHLERIRGSAESSEPAPVSHETAVLVQEPEVTLESQACSIDDPDCESCQ
jgi:ribonucleoside-diphosphate reductase alpha chain